MFRVAYEIKFSDLTALQPLLRAVISHSCLGALTFIIAAGDGFSPSRCQAVTCTNSALSSTIINPWVQNAVNFQSTNNNPIQEIPLKCCLQKTCHFVLASVCYHIKTYRRTCHRPRFELGIHRYPLCTPEQTCVHFPDSRPQRGWFPVPWAAQLGVYLDQNIVIALQWHHDEGDGGSNHQPHDYLLNRLFRIGAYKKSKLRVTGLCEGNSPVTGEFPAQRASNAENVSIWWRHHGILGCTTHKHTRRNAISSIIW